MMELYRKQYRAAGVFFYDYSEHYAAPTTQPLQITNCAFDQLAVGVSGSSAGATVTGCTFTSCWYAGLASQSLRYGPADSPRQPMLVQNNHITLPQYLPFAYFIIGGSAHTPSPGQYPNAYDNSTVVSTYGIKFNDGINIVNNVFDVGSINASRPSVPVGISLTYKGTAIGNKLADLTRGIQAVSGDSYNGTSYTFSQNAFINNNAGTVFMPGISPNYGWSVPAPQVAMRCNSFSGNTGVWVQPDTKFPATMGDDYSPSGPNGNNFSDVTNGVSQSSPSGRKFVYEGVNSFLYWGYNSAQEFQITLAPTNFQGNGPFTGHYDSAYTPTLATCGGPSAPGVYNFTGPIATISPDAIQHQQDSLKLGLSASQQQALLTRMLRSYHPAATYDELEASLRELGQTKPEVYKWATFALLQAYDHTDRPADAQRLRQTLTALAATDGELLSQLRLQEVRGHLQRQYRTLPGSDLTAADLALLRLAAAPDTPAGHQACQLLQAYEPACACTQHLTTRYSPAAARQPDQPTPEAVSILGEGHPNPATEQVSFSYQLPANTPAANLAVYNLLGQRVTTQAVRASVGELTLSVSAFPAGLYLAVLEADGHRLAARKLLVIH